MSHAPHALLLAYLTAALSAQAAPAASATTLGPSART